MTRHIRGTNLTSRCTQNTQHTVYNSKNSTPEHIQLAKPGTQPSKQTHNITANVCHICCLNLLFRDNNCNSARKNAHLVPNLLIRMCSHCLAHLVDNLDARFICVWIVIATSLVSCLHLLSYQSQGASNRNKITCNSDLKRD